MDMLEIWIHPVLYVYHLVYLFVETVKWSYEFYFYLCVHYLKCHYLLSCIFVPNFAIDGAKLLKMLVCDSINIDTSVKRKLLLFAFIQMYSI